MKSVAARAILVLAWSFGVSSFVFSAQVPMGSVTEAFRANSARELQTGSVYLYGDPSLDDLSAVRVFGAVGKAGVHYVPASMDLITLISLAGGTLPTADLEKITIRRNVEGREEVVSVNLIETVTEARSTAIQIKANDTVFVPHEKFIVSDNLARTVSVVAGVTGVIVSFIAISRTSK